MLLLEGKAHVYMFASPGCKKWDTCAPQAVLESAGGILTDVSGKLIPYDENAPHRSVLIHAIDFYMEQGHSFLHW